MKIRKAIITAAGFGSRFLPVTKSIPKEMLPILDKPIIHYLVEECKEAGIEEVIIVASPNEYEKFEGYFHEYPLAIKKLLKAQGKEERFDKVKEIFEFPRIIVIPQDESIPYGNGRPIISAKHLVEDEEAFVVMWGDDLVLSGESSIKQLIEYFNEHPCDGLLAVQEVSDEEISRYGAIKLKEGSNDEVETVIEKPERGQAPTNFASYGRYILTPRIFDYLTPELTGKDNEVWLQDANDLLSKNGVVRYKVIEGEWLTTGDPLRYTKALIKFALAKSDFGPELKVFMKELLEE